MSCWQTLGVNSDADKKTIKLAYAKKLKATRPDDDPEGFIALHQAYKAALQEAARGTDNTAETVQTTGPTHQQSSSASSFRDDGRLAKYAEKATIEASPPTDNVTENSDEILVVSRVEAPDNNDQPDYNDQAKIPVTSAPPDEVPSYELPEYQIRLGADKENALAHAHELIGDPQRVNLVEEWQYVESIPSMIDLDFSADLGDLLFELVV
ncbi:J domain-containing protein [Granulosicoccus antarcticus]|uniref:J domain-containing protein n=1 Tax=Granulosicoccus antarcticus IMCC3135 TaxID=1192854 RepID=A0A2Z2NW22_9GAMM|nr:J domain-containing protein [Granulosicoccus antarcticus]ASJ71344.1 hypothetical protein IMCC3135_06185 [Granulosicoccus antarcticus IMCC3135]